MQIDIKYSSFCKDNYSYKNDLCPLSLKTAVMRTKCPVLCFYSNTRTFCPLKEFEMKRKLLDTVRDKIRFKHYSYQTEKAYVGWIKQFIFFHNKRHPIEMGKLEIEQFLTHLAVNKQVSPTTQNQAFSALLFLYTQVLGIDLKDQNIQALRAQERKHIPVVLTKEEVDKVISNLSGTYQLIVYLMYGCGLRMNEALNIRVKDRDRPAFDSRNTGT